jgi:hypothetical protein
MSVGECLSRMLMVAVFGDCDLEVVGECPALSEVRCWVELVRVWW